MKVLIKSISWTAGAILLGALLAPAQGPGADKNMRMYDPATETSIKGTVEEAKQETHRMMGTHVVVKVGGESKEVMLGPSDFITGQGFSFAKGDSIEVTGSRITMGGIEYIIAREVVKGGKTLTLRDTSGRPQWAGKGMHRGMVPK